MQGCSCAQIIEKQSRWHYRIADSKLNVDALMLLNSAGFACQIDS